MITTVLLKQDAIEWLLHQNLREAFWGLSQMCEVLDSDTWCPFPLNLRKLVVKQFFAHDSCFTGHHCWRTRGGLPPALRTPQSPIRHRVDSGGGRRRGRASLAAVEVVAAALRNPSRANRLVFCCTVALAASCCLCLSGRAASGFHRVTFLHPVV